MEECTMHRAAKNGDLKTVRHMIELGVSVNSRDHCDRTPIHCAAEVGQFEVAEYLVRNNCHLNMRDRLGCTPVLRAALRGHKDIVDLLLQCGAQVNGADEDGWNILHYASWKGWVDVVQRILEKGEADVIAATNNGDTPLILAATNGHKDMVDLLLQCGAQVNGADEDGWNILHYASWYGWVEVVQRILEKDEVDVNAALNDGDTPLILAARNGRKDIVDLLLQRGAQVNCATAGCWNILHYASRDGWVDVVQRILEKGEANVNAATNGGDTPLIMAAINSHRDIAGINVVKQLLMAGADTNIKNNCNQTALSFCLRQGRYDILSIFLLHGFYIEDHDYALISRHPVLKEHVLKDVDLCTQSIVNKFRRQSKPALYSNPDFAKKLPPIKNFKLSDQQTHKIANFVESEIKRNKFCNVLEARPMVLMLMCVQSLLGHPSTMKRSASSDSNSPSKKTRLN